jgi:hypothetical protein
MPFLTATDQPPNRRLRPWLVALLAIPLLLAFPAFWLFGSEGCQVGKLRILAKIRVVRNSWWGQQRPPGPQRFALATDHFVLGSRTYSANLQRPISTEIRHFSFGPYVLTLMQVDTSNATHVTRTGR